MFIAVLESHERKAMQVEHKVSLLLQENLLFLKFLLFSLNGIVGVFLFLEKFKLNHFIWEWSVAELINLHHG